MTSQSEIPVAYAFPVKTSDPDIPVTQVTAVTDVTNDRFPGKNSHNASIVGAPLLIYGTDGKIKSETSFCSKCRDPYDLPIGSTTWRCSNCHHFNNTAGEEMSFCAVS
mmetsp:Transcript_23395/g.53392  ORF Transcript_23395/g.53392 Transcript_23395/m.53392 type:complete len:108 (+) Transcript_23395:231-554(+)